MENVIRQNPGVSDVAVTGIPEPECGELIVACVVRKPGHDITAQNIKDLVKGKLHFVLLNHKYNYSFDYSNYQYFLKRQQVSSKLVPT